MPRHRVGRWDDRPPASPVARRIDRRLCLALAGLASQLAACGRDEPPAQAPVDVLEIVTATVGAPPLRSPTPAAGRRYVVREGDTLSAIAARFGVTEEAIIRANDLSNPDRLLVGQELVIPAPEP